MYECGSPDEDPPEGIQVDIYRGKRRKILEPYNESERSKILFFKAERREQRVSVDKRTSKEKESFFFKARAGRTGGTTERTNEKREERIRNERKARREVEERK